MAGLELRIVTQKSELKFIYSEKATKFCEIFTLILSHAVHCTECSIKSQVKISKIFVAFSEYMNFKKQEKASNKILKSISIYVLFLLQIK